jgi:glycosyltransferase involved in cell wall biosynthesis
LFFSVIVPIYGVEAYLKDCVESVLSQSFTDYELILVDDGSKDACPRLCDEYAEGDSRVRVIHKENGGLVSARKAGLKAAKGEYVLCLDGDDALLPDALETAHRLCTETAADVVSFAYRIYRKGALSEPVCEPASEGIYEKEKLKELVSHAVCDENMEHLFYFACVKAIRRSLLEGYQYAVPETISLGEDLSVVAPMLHNAGRVAISHVPVYRYNIRDDSISTDFKCHQITQIHEVVKHLESALGEEASPALDRYSAFMCLCIFAAAAEGGHKAALPELVGLLEKSDLPPRIRRASFSAISAKSRITMALFRRGAWRMAFAFLSLCGKLKKKH